MHKTLIIIKLHKPTHFSNITHFYIGCMTCLQSTHPLAVHIVFWFDKIRNKGQLHQILCDAKYCDCVQLISCVPLCAVFKLCVYTILYVCLCFIPAPPQVVTPSWDRWLSVLSWAAGGSLPSLCVHPTQQTLLPILLCHVWTMLSGKAKHLNLKFLNCHTLN